MAIEDDVGAAIRMARRLDAGDPAWPRKLDLLGHVYPLGTAIARHPQVAVVRADVKHVRIERRFRQRRSSAALRAADLGRDGAQLVALLHRAKDVVPRRVEDLRDRKSV